ncbi:MAG: peptidylprolyl isomerase [Gammaproteobacteria bacterium]
MSNSIFRHTARYFIFAITMLSTAQAYASDPEEVLIVGEEHFLRFELDEVINGFLPAAVFHGGISDETRKKYTRKAIDALIDRALLYQNAYATGIRVEPTEVESVIEKNIEQFGSKKKFESALKKSGLTLKRFKHRIIQQKAITEHIQSGLAKQSRYSEKELRAYYDDHQQEFDRPETIGLWHIILKVKPNALESTWVEKKKLADSIVSRVKKGETFTKLASEYSEDDYRVKGGWIGYLHKGRLLPKLEDVAFSLKNNEISEPIRSLQGYHIIKAGDRKQEGRILFKDINAELKQRLEKERFEKLKTDLLNGLREKVDIKILIDMT